MTEKPQNRGYCALPGCAYVRGLLLGSSEPTQPQLVWSEPARGEWDEARQHKAPFGESRELAPPPPFRDDLMSIPTEGYAQVYDRGGLSQNGYSHQTTAQKPTLPSAALATEPAPFKAEPQAQQKDLAKVESLETSDRLSSMPAPTFETLSTNAPTRNEIQPSITPAPPSTVESLPPTETIESRAPPPMERNLQSVAPAPVERNVQSSLPPVRTQVEAAPQVVTTPVLNTREVVPYVDASGRPQPLCPSLVLPTSESRFAVALYELARAGPDSTLHVVSLSGKALLSLRIRNSSKIEVSLAMQGDRPRCSILIPEDENPFKICGAGESPYGMFSAVAHNVHEVSVQGTGVYLVEGNSKTLKFSVTTPKGEPVALARVNSNDYPGGDHFEIRTLPGTDTVLVTAVVMAIALFTAPE